MRCGRKSAASACRAMPNATWRAGGMGCRRSNSGRNGLRNGLVIEFVVEWLEDGERLGRKRDRLAAVAGGGGGSTCRRLARHRVKGGADAAAGLDQLALGAACGNRQRELMQMAAAVAEQRQHGADLGRNTLDQ